MKAPYSAHYGLDRFWPELTASSAWKAYAKSNPVEAAKLDKVVGHKLRGEAHSVPTGMTNTHFGDAILMAVLTMPKVTT